MQIGTIIKKNSGFFDVLNKNNEVLTLKLSGNLKNKKIEVLVGDKVLFEDNKFIIDILERKNCLIRPKVANVDLVVIVVSLNQPIFSSFNLNKILCIIESQNIENIIVFTKNDLGFDETNIKIYEEYINQGYKAFIFPNLKNDFDNFKNLFKNKLVVFTGQTGVGKTTLINKIFNLNLLTQEISSYLKKGKHTTRIVEMIIKNDLKIIDTPGFSSFEVNMTPIQIANSYHDFKLLSKNCKYRSCLHFNEKIEDCGIKQAVFQNKISKQRYEDFIKILLGRKIEK